MEDDGRMWAKRRVPGKPYLTGDASQQASEDSTTAGSSDESWGDNSALSQSSRQAAAAGPAADPPPAPQVAGVGTTCIVKPDPETQAVQTEPGVGRAADRLASTNAAMPTAVVADADVLRLPVGTETSASRADSLQHAAVVADTATGGAEAHPSAAAAHMSAPAKQAILLRGHLAANLATPSTNVALGAGQIKLEPAVNIASAPASAAAAPPTAVGMARQQLPGATCAGAQPPAAAAAAAGGTQQAEGAAAAVKIEAAAGGGIGTGAAATSAAAAGVEAGVPAVGSMGHRDATAAAAAAGAKGVGAGSRRAVATVNVGTLRAPQLPMASVNDGLGAAPANSSVAVQVTPAQLRVRVHNPAEDTWVHALWSNPEEYLRKKLQDQHTAVDLQLQDCSAGRQPTGRALPDGARTLFGGVDALATPTTWPHGIRLCEGVTINGRTLPAGRSIAQVYASCQPGALGCSRCRFSDKGCSKCKAHRSNQLSALAAAAAVARRQAGGILQQETMMGSRGARTSKPLSQVLHAAGRGSGGSSRAGAERTIPASAQPAVVPNTGPDPKHDALIAALQARPALSSIKQQDKRRRLHADQDVAAAVPPGTARPAITGHQPGDHMAATSDDDTPVAALPTTESEGSDAPAGAEHLHMQQPKGCKIGRAAPTRAAAARCGEGTRAPTDRHGSPTLASRGRRGKRAPSPDPADYRHGIPADSEGGLPQPREQLQVQQHEGQMQHEGQLAQGQEVSRFPPKRGRGQDAARHVAEDDRQALQHREQVQYGVSAAAAGSAQLLAGNALRPASLLSPSGHGQRLANSVQPLQVANRAHVETGLTAGADVARAADGLQQGADGTQSYKRARAATSPHGSDLTELAGLLGHASRAAAATRSPALEQHTQKLGQLAAQLEGMAALMALAQGRESGLRAEEPAAPCGIRRLQVGGRLDAVGAVTASNQQRDIRTPVGLANIVAVGAAEPAQQVPAAGATAMDVDGASLAVINPRVTPPAMNNRTLPLAGSSHRATTTTPVQTATLPMRQVQQNNVPANKQLQCGVDTAHAVASAPAHKQQLRCEENSAHLEAAPPERERQPAVHLQPHFVANPSCTRAVTALTGVPIGAAGGMPRDIHQHQCHDRSMAKGSKRVSSGTELDHHAMTATTKCGQALRQHAQQQQQHAPYSAVQLGGANMAAAQGAQVEGGEGGRQAKAAAAAAAAPAQSQRLLDRRHLIAVAVPTINHAPGSSTPTDGDKIVVPGVADPAEQLPATAAIAMTLDSRCAALHDAQNAASAVNNRPVPLLAGSSVQATTPALVQDQVPAFPPSTLQPAQDQMHAKAPPALQPVQEQVLAMAPSTSQLQQKPPSTSQVAAHAGTAEVSSTQPLAVHQAGLPADLLQALPALPEDEESIFVEEATCGLFKLLQAVDKQEWQRDAVHALFTALKTQDGRRSFQSGVYPMLLGAVQAGVKGMVVDVLAEWLGKE